MTEKLERRPSARKTESRYPNIEEVYKQFLLTQDFIPISLFKADRNGKILYINQATVSALGYKSKKDILKTTFADWFEDRGQAADILSRAITYQRLEEKEVLLKRKDGTSFFTSFYITILVSVSERPDIFFGYFSDIDEKKKAFQQLFESEEMFRAMNQNLRSSVFIFDQDGYFVYSNPATSEITGYSSEELAKMRFFELVHPDHRDLVLQRGFERLSGKNVIPVYEFKILCKTGEVKWIEISNSRLNITGKDMVIGTAIDTTTRKLYESSLQESENRYKSLYTLLRLMSDNVPDMIWAKDLENRYLFANKVICDHLLGAKDTDEPLGKTDLFFAEREKAGHPGDPDWFNFGEICSKSDLQVLKSRTSMRFQEFGYVRGEFLYLDVHKAPFYDDNGKLIGTVGSARDVTREKAIENEKARSEKLQKTLFYITHSINSTQSLHEIIGIIRSGISEFIDTTNFYIVLLHQETGDLRLPFFQDEEDAITTYPEGRTLTGYMISLGKELLIHEDEIKNLCDNGIIELHGTIPKVWLGVPLKVRGEMIGAMVLQNYKDPAAFTNDDLDIVKFVSTHVALSIDKKIIEDNLHKAKHRAEESDRLKTAFLANMSHEIRTPMNAIVGFSELLGEDDITNETRKEYIRYINDNCRVLLNLLEDIIDISKIESDQLKIIPENCPVNGLLDEVQTIFENILLQSGKSDLQLKQVRGISDEGFAIRTDAHRLRQILSNLIGNSIKFTSTGDITFGYALDENNFIRFFVRDTGIGVPGHMKETIFERFRQVDESNTRKYSGAGLGLTITKRLVELLGGEIWFDSEENKGSTFYFTVPNVPCPEPVREQQPIVLRDIPDLRERHILIAEDEDSNYDLAVAMLSETGVMITRAENGNEAVRMVKENDLFDLVLMDIMMPEMNGYEATILIKKLKPGLPVIALTAYAMPEDYQSCIAAGCNDYLAKPIRIHDLLEKVITYI